MRSQPKIIIRGQVDDLFAIEGAERGLLVIEDAEAEMRAFGFQVVELIGQVRKRIGTGGCGHCISKVQAADLCGSRGFETDQISSSVTVATAPALEPFDEFAALPSGGSGVSSGASSFFFKNFSVFSRVRPSDGL